MWDKCLDSLIHRFSGGREVKFLKSLSPLKLLDVYKTGKETVSNASSQSQVSDQFSSVHFSCSVVSNPLWPHESQHARPPCPSPTPGVHPNSCPSSRWCHPSHPLSPFPPTFNLFQCWRGEWQTTSVFLPWEPHEQYEKAKMHIYIEHINCSVLMKGILTRKRFLAFGFL